MTDNLRAILLWGCGLIVTALICLCLPDGLPGVGAGGLVGIAVGIFVIFVEGWCRDRWPL